MKIQIPSEFRQFQSVPVVCSDRKMFEILSNQTLHIGNLVRLRADGHRGEIYMFNSGAKLSMSEGRHRYHIYGYHYAGQDIKDAIAELLCYEHDYQKRRIVCKYHSDPARFLSRFREG